MRSHTYKEDSFRRYLLGQLSNDEMLRFEQQLLDDGVFYEELLIAEDELIDEYLRAGLSTSETESFQRIFLQTPERQRQLSFAAALKKYVAAEEVAEPATEMPATDLPVADFEVPKPPPRRRFAFPFIQYPALGFALASVVLLSLFGGSWMIVRNWTQSSGHEVITQVLVPGQTRGDEPRETNKFSIPAGKDTVKLQLELITNDYQLYRVALQDSAGTILEQRDLKPQPVAGHFAVDFEVPATKLTPGSYIVRLKGFTTDSREENAGSYYFTVK